MAMITRTENDYQPGLVSIVMPCYNGAQFIEETIDSVLSQSYDNWELIVVDDGSKDESVAIVSKYAQADGRVKQISQENGGSAVARNHGIRLAQGQYISLLDADDLWMPNFLEHQIALMKEKNAICVYSSYARIDEQSQPTLQPVIAKEMITSKDMEAVDQIGCLTGLYDRSKYGKIYLHEELKSLLDDYAYWIDVVKLENRAHGNQEVLAKYRLRTNSLTSNKKALIKKHYHFYRDYRGNGVLQSAMNVLKWGFQGILKYAN